MTAPVSRDLGRALCIITGASKGFGRTLAIQVYSLLKPNSVLLLVARSRDKLNELRADLASSETDRAGLAIRYVVADLREKEGIEETVRAARETPSADIEHLLLINNAASLGDVSRLATSFTDPREVDSYLSLNVSSPLSLTAGLLGAFPQRPGLRRCVVNVSSLCALQPFPSWVLYCTGKAARNMMFQVLAKEEPDLRVLSYAPGTLERQAGRQADRWTGPLDTEMQVQARSTTRDPELRKTLSALHAEGKLLTCGESVAKLVKLLLEDGYQSGAHIDFYDL